MMPTERREFLGVGFDRLSMDQVLQRLSQVSDSRPFQYIVTPNVDHVVRLREDDESEGRLGGLYDEADLCLCDSRVLGLLGRLKGVPLPVVPGSELTALMFDHVIRPGDRIAVVGGDNELLAGLKARYKAIEFVHHSPPMGLRDNAGARHAAAHFIVNARARFTFIAVGSPQQEMIAAEAKKIRGATGAALCIGASLDFLTGREKRAPRFLQQIGLEWAHRLFSNPRRMWRRYLVEGPRIFVLAYRWQRPGAANAPPLTSSGGPIGKRNSSSLQGILAGLFGGLALVLVTAGLLANVNRQQRPIFIQRLPLAHPVEQGEVAPPNILKPLTAEQAVKQNEERPFDAPPDSPAAKFRIQADQDSRTRAVECLAQAVYYEAATEGLDGQRAVAQVVLNRMRHPGFPSTVCGVVYQGSELPTGCQFTFTCDGSLTRTPIQSLWNEARKVATDALAGHVFAPVGHATHYHADYVLPYWADSLAKQVQIGHHIFYRPKGALGTSIAFSQRYGGKEPSLPPPASAVAVASEATGQDQVLLNSALAGPPPVAADAAGIAAQPVPKEMLVADNNRGRLLIDQSVPEVQSRERKRPNDDCVRTESKQILPVSPNDVHARSANGACRN